MAQKNRPTLKQQFSDFINRIAPFDGNALVQKTEHNQVEDDFFDSTLNKTDTSSLINSPGAAIPLDFDSIDLYRIDSSGSVETAFTFTLSNIGTGQVARIYIEKKNNDTFSFSNAVIVPITNIKQTGESKIVFFVHNINGILVASHDLGIAKTNSISDSSDNKLATSKSVNDLNDFLQNQITSNENDISNKAESNIGILTSGGLEGGGDLSTTRFFSIRNEGVSSDKVTDKINTSSINEFDFDNATETGFYFYDGGGAVNDPPLNDNALGILLISRKMSGENYNSTGIIQVFIGGDAANVTATNGVFIRWNLGGSWSNWVTIS